MLKLKGCKALTEVLLVLIFVLPVGTASSAPTESIDIDFWPDGKVYYKFDTGFSQRDKNRILEQMKIWEEALTLPDPGGGKDKSYIEFEECDIYHCGKGGYVLIRYNKSNEKNNMCSFKEDDKEKVGYNQSIRTEFHILQSDVKGPNTIRHELGHCLGLWHEFNRGDADSWLVERPDKDGASFSGRWPRYCKGNDLDFCTKAELMPILGNYDYDSIMHYSFDNPELVVTDRIGNSFGRVNLDRGPSPTYISKRDVSRLLQYYAYEQNHNWGFFQSLNLSPVNSDALPYPGLSSYIRPIGTPALVAQNPDTLNILVRGSDNGLYWGKYKKSSSYPIIWFWTYCCIGSDPAAVSRGDSQFDVVTVSARTGELMIINFMESSWSRPDIVNGGYPTDRIKKIREGEYIGPAITSRGANSLDVFVVTTKGHLSHTTFEKGSWSPWHTLGEDGPKYNVTAQPAAIALSTRKIQLAINESDYYLYEPQLVLNRAPFFTLGTQKAKMSFRTSPALTRRNDPNAPYRVLIVNTDGRLSHRFSSGSWIDIGGIPKPGTGVSAVASSPYGAYIVINGEDATGCDKACTRDPITGVLLPGTKLNQYIQPGGLWLRTFK
jgi:hypothetical protein